ncbi:polysaccharide pyruvyl transferase family protein [Acuticoccus sediminis]|uniref:polysaccharide pyruvyl transferase family protein n=1 Tax=Acuticoccus sediminis TaxID=2184697 RepID=UPI001CFEF453|nr:polysaccharide pyruvyl transferase family protein [Acuticoccus sediminis]
MSAPAPGASGRRALLFGTFDVANYGDLLFPIVAAHRLRPLGWEVVPVAPTMQQTGLEDALQPHALGRLPGGIAGDAVLIGGGEIVHAWPAAFLEEYRVGDLPAWAYPSLWLGASLVGALNDLPIVWNAPGVPSPFPEPLRHTAVESALAAADYVAVRDDASMRFLGTGHSANVIVVPDTVLDLARVWPLETLAPAYTALAARKGIPADAALLAVHVRTAGLGSLAMEDLAASIDAFASARGLTPLLVAIGPCLHDAEAARSLSSALTLPHICLDDPRSLREIAAAIAFSRGYVGNSMHGYVTALGYAKPGVIVARPAFRKFSGIADHVGRAQDVVREWQDGLARLADTLGDTVAVPPSVFDALDRHWSAVAAAIADRDAGRDRRAAFLRRYVSSTLGTAGMGWLLQPVTGRAVVRAA